MKKLRYEPGHHGDKLEDVSYISCGDLREDANGNLLEVPFTMYSDYSGSTVERSNCDAFLELYKELSGVWEVSGGHGTRGVVILASLYDDNEDVRETVDSLKSYPVIDEDALSELECELEAEDWEAWIKHDLRRALDKQQIGYPQDEDVFYECYRNVCEQNGLYWEVESALHGWIDIDQVAKHWEDDTTKADLQRADLLVEYRNKQFTALLFFDQTPREFTQYQTPVAYKVLYEGEIIASGEDFQPYPTVAISQNMLVAQLIERCLWHVHTRIYTELSNIRTELLREDN